MIWFCYTVSKLIFCLITFLDILSLAGIFNITGKYMHRMKVIHVDLFSFTLIRYLWNYYSILFRYFWRIVEVI